MVQVCRHLDLAQEPVGAHDVGELGVQHLDGHRAPVSQVAGEVDCGHAAATQFAVDEVAVKQCGSEPGLQVCQ